MLTQKQRSSKLKRYRARQAKLALERDNNLCRRCGREGSKPHHCYGRAAKWDEIDKKHEERERADKQLTLCYPCHQRCHWAKPPISKQEIIEILKLALEEER